MSTDPFCTRNDTVSFARARARVRARAHAIHRTRLFSLSLFVFQAFSLSTFLFPSVSICLEIVREIARYFNLVLSFCLMYTHSLS